MPPALCVCMCSLRVGLQSQLGDVLWVLNRSIWFRARQSHFGTSAMLCHSTWCQHDKELAPKHGASFQVSLQQFSVCMGPDSGTFGHFARCSDCLCELGHLAQSSLMYTKTGLQSPIFLVQTSKKGRHSAHTLTTSLNLLSYQSINHLRRLAWILE